MLKMFLKIISEKILRTFKKRDKYIEYVFCRFSLYSCKKWGIIVLLENQIQNSIDFLYY